MDAKHLIRLQIEGLWGRGELGLADRLYTADTRDHMPVPGQAGGVAALKGVVAAFRAAIPDMAITVHAILGQGDRAADVWTLEGTHRGDLPGLPASGRPLRFSGIDRVRVAGGRVTDIWHVEDLLAMAAQMGAPPASLGEPFGTLDRPGSVLAAPDSPPGPADGAAWADAVRLLLHGRRPGLLAEGLVDHTGWPGQAPGAEGLAQRFRWLTSRFAGWRPTVGEPLADGAFALVPFVLEDGGRALNGMAAARFDDRGQVAEAWHTAELLQARQARWLEV